MWFESAYDSILQLKNQYRYIKYWCQPPSCYSVYNWAPEKFLYYLFLVWNLGSKQTWGQSSCRHVYSTELGVEYCQVNCFSKVWSERPLLTCCGHCFLKFSPEMNFAPFPAEPLGHVFVWTDKTRWWFSYHFTTNPLFPQASWVTSIIAALRRVKQQELEASVYYKVSP